VRARFLGVALALAGAWGPSTPFALAATLIHSNDVMGDLEPCGCRTNPLGGMARKFNLMKGLSDSADSLLVVDAGDSLFSSSSLPELLRAQSELQAGFLLKALELGHQDVIVPGEKDFALGVKALDRLRAKSKIKFLAANLVKRSGAPFLKGSALFQLKSPPLKVAVIGLVGDVGYPKELKVTSAIAAAKREVAQWRKRADLIVVVTHQGSDEDRKLAAAVPGIDVIVGAHTQSFFQTPVAVGATRVFQSSFRNQYVGLIPLAKKLPTEGYRLVAMDAGYDSPKEAPTPMDALVEEFKKSVGELNTREEAKLVQESAGKFHAESKYQTFPKCAECHLKQFDFWRKTRHARALEPLIEKHQDKNKECLGCHTVGLGDPRGFNQVGHLAEFRDIGLPDEGEMPWKPFETEALAPFLKQMREASSVNDEVRLTQTHPAVPLRQALGQLRAVQTPVQCENCHGAGEGHPFTGAGLAKVKRETCVQCHTAEQAPDWYVFEGPGEKNPKPNWEKIDAKLASVRCPAGDLEE
jgi:hypothetical protein